MTDTGLYCPMIEVELRELDPGDWELRVSCYSNKDASWTPALILKIRQYMRPSLVIR